MIDTACSPIPPREIYRPMSNPLAEHLRFLPGGSFTRLGKARYFHQYNFENGWDMGL
jgi:hypothetical protein